MAMKWGHPARQRLALFAGDLFLVCLSAFLGALLRLGEPINVFRVYTGASLVFITSFLAMLYILDAYDSESLANRNTRLVRVAAACVVGALLSSTSFYLLPGYRYGRGILVLSAALPGLLAYSWRGLYRRYARVLVQAVPTLIVGTGRGAGQLRQLLTTEGVGYEFAGFVRTSGMTNEEALDQREILGAVDRLEVLVRQHKVRCLVMLDRAVPPDQASKLTKLKFEGVSIFDALEFSMRVGEHIPIEFLEDSWLWFTEGFQLPQARVVRQVMRLRDIVLASTGLLFTLPISFILVVLIKLESCGPVFHVQDRVGLQEKTFGMIKFRSMYLGAEKEHPLWTAVGDSRVTRVGRVMRLLHLDEIPQMVNVLRGEMSFIGPRPERPLFVDELKDKIPFYHLRHYVRPGITGWAQVNFPYSSSLEETRLKLEYDLYYAVNASFLLDMRILFRTLRVIIHRRGSRQPVPP
jgi:exopolysaccharide biosynthesis polyprenyl glycosylphosphotransferase